MINDKEARPLALSDAIETCLRPSPAHSGRVVATLGAVNWTLECFRNVQQEAVLRKQRTTIKVHRDGKRAVPPSVVSTRSSREGVSLFRLHSEIQLVPAVPSIL